MQTGRKPSCPTFKKEAVLLPTPVTNGYPNQRGIDVFSMGNPIILPKAQFV